VNHLDPSGTSYNKKHKEDMKDTSDQNSRERGKTPKPQRSNRNPSNNAEGGNQVKINKVTMVGIYLPISPEHRINTKSRDPALKSLGIDYKGNIPFDDHKSAGAVRDGLSNMMSQKEKRFEETSQGILTNIPSIFETVQTKEKVLQHFVNKEVQPHFNNVVKADTGLAKADAMDNFITELRNFKEFWTLPDKKDMFVGMPYDLAGKIGDLKETAQFYRENLAILDEMNKAVPNPELEKRHQVVF
jgi:hypothetical protein